jgi:hypothetical protein
MLLRLLSFSRVSRRLMVVELSPVTSSMRSLSTLPAQHRYALDQLGRALMPRADAPRAVVRTLPYPAR